MLEHITCISFHEGNSTSVSKSDVVRTSLPLITNFYEQLTEMQIIPCNVLIK